MPALKERAAADGQRTARLQRCRRAPRARRHHQTPPGDRRARAAFAASRAARRSSTASRPIRRWSIPRFASCRTTVTYARVVSARTNEDAVSVGAISDAPTQLAQSLDQRGTRGAPRVTIARGDRSAGRRESGGARGPVDGWRAGVVGHGLKPNQRVRVTLTDDRGTVRFSGTIAWAYFEIPPAVSGRASSSSTATSAAIDALRAQTQGVRTSSLRIVSSRSDPVETIAAGTPDTSSSRAM